MTLLALRSPSTTRDESRSAGRRIFAGPLRAAYSALLAGKLAPPEFSPIRVGGAWLIDDRTVSAHLGVDVPNPADEARDRGGIKASSWLRLDRAGRVRLQIGWQGTLELRVEGAQRYLGHHDSWATREIGVVLRAGDSELEVRLDPNAPTDARRFQLVAFAANGHPLLPRPRQSAPVERAAGSNLGRRLGLGIPQATLLFGVGLAALTFGLVRAVRREGQHSADSASHDGVLAPSDDCGSG